MYQSTSLKSPDLGLGTGMFGEKVTSGRPLILNTSEVKKNVIHIILESVYFQLTVTGYMQSLTYQPIVNISIVPKVLYQPENFIFLEIFSCSF